MDKQITLPAFSDELANVRTKKKEFPAQIDRIVPWGKNGSGESGRAFSEFCGVGSSNQVPDGDTLGRFRHILAENGIQQKLFAQVIQSLTEKGPIRKKGTTVDSTITEAPSSAKNKKQERDSDAHQVKKGNTWHFGYHVFFSITKTARSLFWPNKPFSLP